MNERCRQCGETIISINGRFCIKTRTYVERRINPPCETEPFKTNDK